jgi:hypothetical protein
MYSSTATVENPRQEGAVGGRALGFSPTADSFDDPKPNWAVNT